MDAGTLTAMDRAPSAADTEGASLLSTPLVEGAEGRAGSGAGGEAGHATTTSTTTSSSAAGLTNGLSLESQEGIRGLCSILVVVGHMCLYWVPNRDGEYWPLGLDFLSPVSLFFLISGFALVTVYDRDVPVPTAGEVQVQVQVAPAVPPPGLAYPQPEAWAAQGTGQGGAGLPGYGPQYVPVPITGAASFPAGLPFPLAPSSTSPLSTPAERSTFFRRRVARLAPVYYLGLALAIPQLMYTDLFGKVSSVVLDMLWLQAIPCLIGNSWNGPLWTASAFVFCYLAFPRALGWLRRKTVPQLWRVFGACCAASAIVAYVWLTYVPGGLEMAFFLHAFVGFRLIHFVLGMCAGLLARRSPFTYPTLAAELCTLLQVLSLAACLAVNWLLGPVFYLIYMWYAEFLFVGIQATWLMALAQPGCGGVTKAVFNSVPLKWLGGISYALYCLHWPTINWVAWAAAGKGVTYEAVPQYFVYIVQGWFFFPAWAIPLLLLVCIGVAALAHRFLEAPARKAIRSGGKGGD